MNKPLSYKLRPKTLKDVIGQEHLIGKDKVITNLVNNKKIFSMILYGEPGIGKTTIASCIANDIGIISRTLNAVINSKKDFEIVFEEAKMHDELILIVDEIHRLNKDKQDLLLPYIENGLVTLIGLTTSNPYHSINPAIRSRTQIYKLEPIKNEEIIKALNKAIKSPYLKDINIDDKSIEYIANSANNDLRYAYNLLEVLYYSSKDKTITIDIVKDLNNEKNISLFKTDDEYYDLLSALQKSIRGSDVDASLYYLAKLIVLEDLDIISRRLLVIAYEDISLANPNMGMKVKAAIDTAHMIGFPEARMPLSQIVIEMALSPKSNSSYLGINKALEDVLTNRADNIPEHIKNHKTSGYKYPFDYDNNYIYQRYLPNNLKKRKYYKSQNNVYENKLKEIDSFVLKQKEKNNYD